MVVGDYLVSVLVPCDQGSGEGGEGRLVDDGCSALSHRLSLLLCGEGPHNWRRKRDVRNTGISIDVSNYRSVKRPRGHK